MISPSVGGYSERNDTAPFGLLRRLPVGHESISGLLRLVMPSGADRSRDTEWAQD